MHRAEFAAALITAGGLLFASAVRAEQTPTVWYRAADQCPDGQAFLDAIGTPKSRTRLAAAGDRIDFVVTILTDQSGSLGRLERATEAGTVAIREVRDASCERVAKALALSLGLALGPQTGEQNPAQDPAASAATPDATRSVEPPPEHTDVPHVTAPPAPASVRPPETSSPRTEPSPAAEGRPGEPPVRPIWAVGVHGGLLTGLQPRVVGRYGAFAEARRLLPTVLPRLALRAGVVAALGSYDTEIGPVRRWLGAVTLDACPVALGDERLSVAPCLGGELGASGASGSEQGFFGARALWGAVTASVRGTWSPSAPLGLYLDAGALAPLGGQKVKSEVRVLYETDKIGLFGSLGLAFGFE
jgi:hypothetical protein